MRRVRFIACGASLALLVGCKLASTAAVTSNSSPLARPSGVQLVDFASGTVIVHTENGKTHRLKVELAESEAQRQRGLMYRMSMPAESGMLFIYPVAQVGGFWMLNTSIPLSVAYAGIDGVIFQITDMNLCQSPSASICAQAVYPARAPFHYALEVNQGFFAGRGIGVGDRIEYRRE